MSIKTSRDWIKSYDILKVKIQQKRQNGILVSNKDITELNGLLDVLLKSLNAMQSSPMEYEISSSEIARRQIILDNLKKQLTMIPLSTKSDRVSFGIESPHSSTSSTNTYNQPFQSAPATTIQETNSPLTSQGLILRQKEVMAQQDLMINEIGVGVDRLHQQAIDIGSEVKTQNKILDELDTQVDKAADSLREEAKHAEQIRQSSNVCIMYICIVVEVIIIVVILIVLFGFK